MRLIFVGSDFEQYDRTLGQGVLETEQIRCVDIHMYIYTYVYEYIYIYRYMLAGALPTVGFFPPPKSMLPAQAPCLFSTSTGQKFTKNTVAFC